MKTLVAFASALFWVGHCLAQEAIKAPSSVIELTRKYDESRRRTLLPLLDAYASELKLKTVPALTRAGKAAAAVTLQQALEKLKSSAIPVLPGLDAPFQKEVFEAVQSTPEWIQFTEKFGRAEDSLNENYKKALDRERTRFQNIGDPSGVVAIDVELKRIESLKSGQPVAAEAPKVGVARSKEIRGKASVYDKRRIESWLVGKTWLVVDDADHQLLYFAKDGKGARMSQGKVTTALQWRIEDDGRVSVEKAGMGKVMTLTSPSEGTIVIHGQKDPNHPVKLVDEVIPGTK